MPREPRDKRHLLVRIPPNSEQFSPVTGFRDPEPRSFAGNKREHGLKLKSEYESATTPRFDVGSSANENIKGSYLTFLSFPGIELVLESLDSRARGQQIELLAVSHELTAEGEVHLATVFVPDGKKSYLLNKLDKYIETSEASIAKNAKLLETVSSIRRATIRELWTDAAEEFPTSMETVWWEVWLTRRNGTEYDRFKAFAESNNLMLSRDFLGFNNRTVLLVRAGVEDLGRAIESLDDFAELRRPHDIATFLVNESPIDQADWVGDLISRLSPASNDAPAACLIDTGVQQTHPLLSGSLEIEDVHSLSGMPSRVTDGHGTEMAGLALFGDLEKALASSLPVSLGHPLESVKFLSDGFRNTSGPMELYGAVTAQAVDLPEIQAPRRRRVFSLATTATYDTASIDGAQDLGRPTSWSATIDALAAGCSIDYSVAHFAYLDLDQTELTPRLFVVSTGNIRDVRAGDNHLDRSDLEPVEDPSQAWNVITVGAYSERDDMSGAIPSFSGYVPLATRGELSPTSRTSVVFNSSKWPVKPDVVEDGGNLAVSPDGSSVQSPENLAILTTRWQRLGDGAFTTTRDTSAATAKVTSIAANILASYPDYWPETVRALVVHSAEWTSRMKASLERESRRDARSKLFRRYGMGVPNLGRALNSAADDLTLVSQSTIRPFEHLPGQGNDGRAWEMNLHELPWPTEILESLGEAPVKLRITLSYFIKPNPSRRGWTGRYIYPSYGLRFAVRRATESTEDFRRRINKRAREEGEQLFHSESEGNQWFFGANQQQSAGSLHTDIWSGSASELAQKGVIAVYPVTGWWKFNKQRNLSNFGVRYSLVVSIESPELGVDLWTPVYQQIQTAVPIQT